MPQIRRPHQVAALGCQREPEPAAARRRGPERRREARERGDEDHLLAMLRVGLAVPIELRRLGDQPEPLEPGDSGAGGVDLAVEAVGRRTTHPPGDAGGEPRLRVERGLARRREDERAGPVRALCLAGGEARLGEQRCLLVDCQTRDRHSLTERIGLSDRRVAVDDPWLVCRIELEQRASLVRPFGALEIQQQGARGGGSVGDRLAREPEIEPSVDRGHDTAASPWRRSQVIFGAAK